MARTNAQKRQASLAAGRARQARRRQRMLEAGKPDTMRVDGALVEAMAFELASAVLGGAQPSAALPIAKLIDTALTILVDRQGYDRRQSKLAIAQRMSLRDDHRDPSYVPSLHPNVNLQSARAAMAQ